MEYKNIQENMNVQIHPEKPLPMGLCHRTTVRTTGRQKCGWINEQHWSASGTVHSAKQVIPRDQGQKKQLVQTNLMFQHLEQPEMALSSLTLHHGQQSNIEHSRRKYSPQNTINRSYSNTISILHLQNESKYLGKDKSLSTRNSRMLVPDVCVSGNQGFVEMKQKLWKKQNKCFLHKEENLLPLQLRIGQEDVDAHVRFSEVSDHFYESSCPGSLQHGLTMADLSLSGVDHKSDTLHSILKSSQTSASLHRSMLSLQDNIYKAQFVSGKSQSPGPLKVWTSSLTVGDEKQERPEEVDSSLRNCTNVLQTHHCINNCNPCPPHSKIGKFSQNEWKPSLQILNNNCQPCSPELPCVSGRSEISNSNTTAIETDVSAENYDRSCRSSGSGELTMFLKASLTSPDNTRDFPIRSGALSDDTTKTQTGLRPAADGMQVESLSSLLQDQSLRNLNKNERKEEKSDLESTRFGSRSGLSSKPDVTRGDLRAPLVPDSFDDYNSQNKEEPYQGEVTFVKTECGECVCSHKLVLKDALGSSVPGKCPPQSFTLQKAASQDVSVERLVERSLKLYQQGLVSRCLRAWYSFVKWRYRAAEPLQHQQLLRKGLRALRWAVELQRIQAELLERWQRAQILAHYFSQWRDRVSTCPAPGSHHLNTH